MLKDKDDVINGLFFVNMKESKGFRIINRIVDDAHVNNIISEISNLQKIFSKWFPCLFYDKNYIILTFLISFLLIIDVNLNSLCL